MKQHEFNDVKFIIGENAQAKQKKIEWDRPVNNNGK